MSYSLQDLYNFYIKDGKTQISIGVMNAFTSAVNAIIAKEGKITPKAIQKMRDVFFEENQKKIEDEYTKWLSENTEEKFVKETKVIAEKLKEADMPTIQQGENPEIPTINE